MHFPFVYAFLFLATHGASQLFDASSGIPACASICSEAAFTRIGCSSTGTTTTVQWECICDPGDGFFVNAVPCFNANCTASDFQATSNWFTGECSFVGVEPPPFSAILDGQLPPPPPGGGPGGRPPPPPGAPPPPGEGPPPPPVNVSIVATTTIYTVPSPTSTSTQSISSTVPPTTTSSSSFATSTSSKSAAPTSSATTLPVEEKQTSTSISSGAIGGIAASGVLVGCALVFGLFFFLRRRKRNSRSRTNVSIGEDDIKMLPQKSLSLRYPNNNGRHYSANLGSDERDPPPSPFQPKFAPALISISRA